MSTILKLISLHCSSRPKSRRRSSKVVVGKARGTAAAAEALAPTPLLLELEMKSFAAVDKPIRDGE